MSKNVKPKGGRKTRFPLYHLYCTSTSIHVYLTSVVSESVATIPNRGGCHIIRPAPEPCQNGSSYKAHGHSVVSTSQSISFVRFQVPFSYEIEFICEKIAVFFLTEITSKTTVQMHNQFKYAFLI